MTIKATIALTRESGFSLEVDVCIEDRGITTLFGPSGSGKSTLLRLLAGLESGRATDSIHIEQDGHVWQSNAVFLPPEQRKLGLVFQQHQLFPHLTVAENLQFAARRKHTDNTPATKMVCDWLDLEHLLDRKPQHLSGGEAQRAAIARVILNGATCILMDEPLGAIDQSAKNKILPYLSKLHRNLNIPIVYVSHSIEEISYLADYLFVLDKGRIKTQGPFLALSSSLPLQTGDAAASVIVCKVIGHDTVYNMTEMDFSGNQLFVNDLHYKKGDSIRLRVPASDVSIAISRPQDSSIQNIIESKIVELNKDDHASVLVKLVCGDQFINARITAKSVDRLGLEVNQRVFAQIKSVALLRDNAND